MNKRNGALTVYDSSGAIWSGIMHSVLANAAHVIALRGAGSFNGISINDADRIVEQELFPRVERYLHDGRVCIIYDGDNDDPAYPDIGHIMGRLRDCFGDRITCYAVQVESWYRYRDDMSELRPLHSATGNGYQTVVFPDKTFPGDHDYFSQNELLCRLSQYEQWYIGACGEIANKQLADYSRKMNGTRGRAFIFPAKVSETQEQKIRRKLAETIDAEKAKRLSDSLVRRAENPFGLLFTPDGAFIQKPEYGKLDIQVF